MSFYLFITIFLLSFYLNIVCINIVCELGLSDPCEMSVLYGSTCKCNFTKYLITNVNIRRPNPAGSSLDLIHLGPP